MKCMLSDKTVLSVS